jgi:hypothetical protein
MIWRERKGKGTLKKTARTTNLNGKQNEKKVEKGNKSDKVELRVKTFWRPRASIWFATFLMFVALMLSQRKS